MAYFGRYFRLFLSAVALAALAAVAIWIEAGGIDEFRPESSGQTTRREPDQKPTPLPESGQTSVKFDSYVLALSWSPSYCEAEGGERDKRQCGENRPFAFVVHGLWPQGRRERLEFCATNGGDLPGKLVDRMLDIMPAPGLIMHQWRKHGTCSGQSMEAYFGRTRAAFDAVTIPAAYRRLASYRSVDPAQVRRDFVAANPGLPAEAVMVTCDRRYLREVRICLDPQLGYRRCTGAAGPSCQLPKAVMPPVRSG